MYKRQNVGLCSKEYLKRDVDASLSGGELKRIEIASLMARNPKLAIYDLSLIHICCQVQ